MHGIEQSHQLEPVNPVRSIASRLYEALDSKWSADDSSV